MLRKIIPVLALCLPLFLIPGEAEAFNGSQTGQITSMIVRSSDGLIYFFLSGSMNGPAACATLGYWMIKDENSATGKRQFALLTAARLTGTVITVTGTGACTRWGNGEDVDGITI